MAKGFKLDTLRNDIIYTDGQLETVDRDDEISRNVKTRLSISIGEYFLDESYGFPYNEVFGSRIFSLTDLETTIKQFILETEGILNLTRFEIDFEQGNTRKLKVSFSAQTIYGSFLTLEANPFGV